MADRSRPTPRGCSTICLPFAKDLYQQVVADPALFRQALDRFCQMRLAMMSSAASV
jgi:hypothetical protein